MFETTSVYREQNLLETLRNYYQLTKPRIIPLLLITTTASMAIASQGRINLFLLSVTLLGGTLAAASAQVLNCVYDRDIDYKMTRTRQRPLPAGKIRSTHALIFAAVLGIFSFALIAAFTNLLAALLAMTGILFYVLVYTHWLKRHTTQNIVIGGVAGSIPSLVGWAATTGDLSLTAWILFTIVFLWTPSHFWSLALMIKKDYTEVSVPMLPSVEGEETTVKSIWVYSCLLVPCSFLLLKPVGDLGFIYGAMALYLGYRFLYQAKQLKNNPFDYHSAREMFKYSIFYMMLLNIGIIVDTLSIAYYDSLIKLAFY